MEIEAQKNMKKCRQCGCEINDFVSVCHHCAQGEFQPAVLSAPRRPGPRKIVSKIPHVITETVDKISILKCRTPDEAFLVAEELEAADILVIFPDDEAMWQEFKTEGCVSIKVLAQSYAAARDLQEVIECRQWRKIGEQRLSVEMVLLGIGLGVIFLPGLVLALMVCRGYETKGYLRKAKTFLICFTAGFALDIILFIILVMQ
jgi:hypothetical protein